MNNKEVILQFIKNNPEQHYCDDCLSKKLKINPRQQVNQICNKSRYIIRRKTDKIYCTGNCKKFKLLNYIK